MVCGLVFMMDGRVFSNMWPYSWVMALVFFFGMINGLEITHLKCSILSCMCCEILKYLQVYEPYRSIVGQERGRTHRDLNDVGKLIKP